MRSVPCAVFPVAIGWAVRKTIVVSFDGGAGDATIRIRWLHVRRQPGVVKSAQG